ncbi:MAG TPA: VOC family protein [Vicinamibacterales bacterium]|jgi:catechol 2,3-dioxygenase-like lactoylglutathione lyase family enzyme|nr:VOC family protein [Vicinamibacterales bacterium]
MEISMLTRALLVTVLTAVPASSLAQTGFADLIDHIHLAAPDQAKAVEWYHTHFGAELTPEGTDRAMLGTTRLIFQKSESPKPSTGSILGLIGFSVADVDGTVKKLQGAGVKIAMPTMTMYGVKMAQVVDPWGTLIDVVQDSKKLGLHHIGLVSSDPAATLAWFAETFGGKVAKFDGGADGINYGGVWVTARKGTGEPSAGHSIDHIGFRPLNVDSVVATLKTKNVKVTTEPRPLTLPSGTTMRLAFIEGPGGVRIELVQRDNLK